jgi:hypothetical protein
MWVFPRLFALYEYVNMLIFVVYSLASYLLIVLILIYISILLAYSFFQKKVKLSLCLIKHYAMKTYKGTGCIDQRFLGLGPNWR